MHGEDASAHTARSDASPEAAILDDDTLRGRSSVCSFLYAPRNSINDQQYLTVHSVNSNEFFAKQPRRRAQLKLYERPDIFARTLSEKLTGPWIEQVFSKRECIRFIPSGSSERCGCGRSVSGHSASALSSRSSVCACSCEGATRARILRWTIAEHTAASHTDAFGTLEFLGGTHAHKAHYVRLGYDSDPSDIMYLMEKVWQLDPPRLVITVHGGITNFEVQDKLGRVFREGLLKAAQTTGAWIITAGIDSGVVRHVAAALDEAGISARMRSKIVTIGIAPWGLIKRRERLVGKGVVVPYDPHSCSTSRSKFAILNDRHSYFLLVDNGTSGRYGADIILRKRFEEFIAQKQTIGCGTRRVPVVCAVLEGGTCTIRAVLQYLTNDPPVPVIVCDGSGRASDLLSFAYRHVQQDGTLSAEVHEQLLSLTASVFRYSSTLPEQLLSEILRCVKHRELLTIFRLGESRRQDVDHAILTALLKGQNLSLSDQLDLTLAWNRVDIARFDVFVGGQQWPAASLHNAMMDALTLDRVDFVKLLLENGVSMKKFLTINRLEQLYNTEEGPHNALHRLIRSHTSRCGEEATLPEIGAVIERLMGNAYRSYYTSRQFKSKYEKYRKKAQISRIPSFRSLRASYSRERSKSEVKERLLKGKSHREREIEEEVDFKHPFNELMLWAVLCGRQEMARCMWLHGEEAMAKALTAVRLYKCMSKEAADDYLEVEISDQLREFAEEFKGESLELLDHCYQQDDGNTLRLLTAELPNWGHHTCLSLAVIANNKQFLAHPCCQILLADLWHGGLRIRSQSNIKVILALAFPPAILLLDVKSVAERTQVNSSDERLHFTGFDDSDSDEKKCSSAADDDQKLRGQSDGNSVVSFHLSSLFKSTRKSLSKPGALARVSSPDKPVDLVEVENLMENGEQHRKVQIISSRKFTDQLSAPSSRVTRELPTTWTTKIAEFYSAPITTFWAWSLSFASFLFALTYVLLIEFPKEPTAVEWFLVIYVSAFTMEHFRKLMAQEASSLTEKICVFFNRYWNYLTAFAILSFFVGFAFRVHTPTRHTHGRVILACNSVLWYIKVLDFMSVHPRLGPYITMAGKMVLNMSYIIVLLLVTLMAFGISRQSITYPHEKWNWLLVRNIFYKPYFMLYGEVYAGEIDTCGDEGTNCVPGIWIPPMLMTVFLLVANILLINMLIAIFNNIFNVTNAMSQQVWLFQRYEQVMEYENTPLIPPPFTPLAHLFSFLRCIFQLRKRNRGRRANGHEGKGLFDFAMKLRLDDEEMRKLHDFEEDCMDDLSRKKAIARAVQSETRLQATAERTELMYARLSEMLNEEWSVKTTIGEFESRLETIERTQRKILQLLQRGDEERKESGGKAKELRRCSAVRRGRQRSQSTGGGDYCTLEEKTESERDELAAIPRAPHPVLTALARQRHSQPRLWSRRNEGYTSITDGIRVVNPVPKNNEEFLETPSAKPSFALRQNEMLRTYEEVSSRITSDIIESRTRHESSTFSICEDLLEMNKATCKYASKSSQSDSSDSPVQSATVLSSNDHLFSEMQKQVP